MKNKTPYQLLKEKQKKLEKKIEKRNKEAKVKELKKKVRKMQVENIKTQLKPYGSALKKAWDWSGKVAGNITANTEAQRYGVTPGMRLLITNGRYSGQMITIMQTIPGGVTGRVSDGSIINIRYSGLALSKPSSKKTSQKLNVNQLERYY